MDEWITTILCVLGILLLIVMVVGHLLWLLFAAIFRALFGDGAAACTPVLPASQLTPTGAAPTYRDGRRQMLIELQQQVRRWQHQGIFTSVQVQALQAWIARELQQLSAVGGQPGVGSEAARPGDFPRPTVAEGMPAADRATLPEGAVAPQSDEHPASAMAAAAAAEEAVTAELVVAGHSPDAFSQAAPPAYVREGGEGGEGVATSAKALPVHPLDRREEPVTIPRPVQRPWTDMLRSFMEERNIRWAELLSAGLIVLCSVGLVASLWATLQQIPYFPALLFTLFTVAFHSAGLYTLRQWKLETVSRVILLIGLVLVPLTFCAGVLLSTKATPAGGLVVVLAVAGVLGWVAWSASGVLVPDLAGPLAAGVVLCGLALVPIQRVAQPQPAMLTLLILPPLVGLVLVGGALGVRLARWRQLSRPRLVRTMRALGVSLFAFLVPLALLLARQDERRDALATLSPWLSLVAAGLVGAGLCVQQRTTARALAEWRTVGTAIALCAAAALLGLLAVAWPAPLPLLAASAVAGLALVYLGARGELPLLWPPAVAYLALASTIGLHLIGGQLPWSDGAPWHERSQRLIQTLLMARNSLWLGLVAAGLFLGARRMSGVSLLRARVALPVPDEASGTPAPLDHRAGGVWQLVDALHSPRAALALSAGGLAAIGLAIAVFAGFVPMESWPQDRRLAGPLLAAYGVGSLVAGFAAQQVLWVGFGSAVLWLALVQMLAFPSWIETWKETLLGTQHPKWAAVTTACLIHGWALTAAAMFLDLLAAWGLTRGLASRLEQDQAAQKGRHGGRAGSSSTEGSAAGGLTQTAAATLLAGIVLLYSTVWTSWQHAQDIPWRTIFLLQVSALAGGVLASLWASLQRWRQRAVASEPPGAQRLPTVPGVGGLGQADGLSPVSVALAAAFLGLGGLGGLAAWEVFQQPDTSSPLVQQVGHGLTHVAVGALALGVLAAGGWPEGVRGLWPVLAALVPAVAAALARLDPSGRWLAYHGLEAGWGLVGLAGVAAVFWRREAAAPAGLLCVLVPLATLLALRGNWHDPQEPWWSLAALGLCGATATAAALAWRSIPWSWASWGYAGLTALALCVSPSGWTWVDTLPAATEPLVAAELVFLSLVAAAGGWLALEIWSQRQGKAPACAGRWPRVHDMAIGVLVVGWLLRKWLYAQLVSGDAPAPWSYHAWAAAGTLALGTLVAAALWEERAWYALPAAYFWGLAGWGVLVAFSRDVVILGWLADPEWVRATAPFFVGWSHERSMQAWQLGAVWTCTALALHTAIGGQLWFHGARLAAWGTWLGIPHPVEGLQRTQRWLPTCQVSLTALVALLATWLVLMAELRAVRVAAAILPAVAAWGLACLAQGKRQEKMQLAALLLAGYAAVLLGWVETVGGAMVSMVAMLQAFRLLMVLCGLTFVYAWVLPRWLLRDPAWRAASYRAATTTAALAAGALAVTFAFEVALFTPEQGTPADGLQVIAVALLMLLGAAGLVALALVPSRDPWQLSEQGRQAYVYAAEAVLVLAGAHLYLCRPEWFALGLRPYWPLVVLAIAFAGAGASELAQRWQLPVLAEPLKRSSQLLPLLPVLSWWVVGSQVDYALLLLAVGLVYLVLSWNFRSWASGLAAVVAGNAALWRWYSDQHLSLVTNPQLWLIPPAASMLVAAQWHRQRLQPQMLTAIRYAATLVIYVSCTSEIMVGGFAGRLWQPMILLGLAVAGALAGIGLRVRAFLILGSAFTMVALLTMVRQAQREIGHVWPWWVFGISLGVTLLVLMGIFEKKRAALERLTRELAQWDG